MTKAKRKASPAQPPPIWKSRTFLTAASLVAASIVANQADILAVIGRYPRIATVGGIVAGVAFAFLRAITTTPVTVIPLRKTDNHKGLP